MSQKKLIHGFHAVNARLFQSPKSLIEIYITRGREDRRMQEALAKAADEVINRKIPRAGGDGGAIALGADGSVAFPFNTEGMYRGWISSDGVPHVAVFAGEDLPMP